MEKFVLSIQNLVSLMKQHMPFVFGLLIFLWLFQLINKLLHYRLNRLGIRPRRLSGLLGIFVSPFLHANFEHLFFNSIPLFVLASFVLLEGYSVFYSVSLSIIIISGSALWLFGRRATHIGASSLIMGYLGYLMANAYYQGTVVAIALGIVTAYYFGVLLMGIFPTEARVSWEGHLFGLLAGFATAFLLPILLGS